MNGRFVDNSFVPTAVPTPRQLEYQSWEMGIFFHFGIRAFYEGHRDWDGKPMPTDGFRPTALDCNGSGDIILITPSASASGRVRGAAGAGPRPSPASRQSASAAADGDCLQERPRASAPDTTSSSSSVISFCRWMRACNCRSVSVSSTLLLAASID